MKEKLAMFLVSVVCVTSCVAVTGLAIKNSTGDHPAIIKAEDKVYSLTIDSPLYTGEGTSGEGVTTVKTAYGNDIKLKYNKLFAFDHGENGVQSGFNSMTDGSYIEILNNDDIHGLAGIRHIHIESSIRSAGDLTIHYGWAQGQYVSYFHEDISSTQEGIYDFDFEESPSYVKIETATPYLTMGLGEITFTYSCEEVANPYPLVNNFYLHKVDDHYEAFSYIGDETTLTFPGKYGDVDVTAIADNFKFKNGAAGIVNVTLPASITKIGYRAFFCDVNDTGMLTNINLDNVKHISDGAFQNNDNFGRTVCPNIRYVEYIGVSAFFSTSFVNETLIFSAPNLSIQSTAFRLTGIKNLRFESSTSLRLGGQAFSKCPNLESVTLPKNTTYLGGHLFEDTPKLSTITYNGTVAEFNAIEKALYWEEDGSFTNVHCIDDDIIINRKPKS